MNGKASDMHKNVFIAKSKYIGRKQIQVMCHVQHSSDRGNPRVFRAQPLPLLPQNPRGTQGVAQGYKGAIIPQGLGLTQRVMSNGTTSLSYTDTCIS